MQNVPEKWHTSLSTCYDDDNSFALTEITSSPNLFCWNFRNFKFHSQILKRWNERWFHILHLKPRINASWLTLMSFRLPGCCRAVPRVRPCQTNIPPKNSCIRSPHLAHNHNLWRRSVGRSVRSELEESPLSVYSSIELHRLQGSAPVRWNFRVGIYKI